MKNLGYIASEITKGKNLEENLEKYGKGGKDGNVSISACLY